MTGATWLKAPGVPVPTSSLTCTKARALVEHLVKGADHYSDLVECRSSTHTEVVVLDTEVSIPQGGSKYGIQESERIAVVFPSADDRIPEILALRPSFPRMSHQNLRKEEVPRSLCITDVQYDELRRRWTARLLLQLLRTWLEEAAHGSLHREDQALEPFFLGPFVPLVVPRDIFLRDSPAPLRIETVTRATDSAATAYLARAAREPGDPQPELDTARTLAFTIRTAPAEHGVIRRQPRTLADVVAVLQDVDFDLLAEMRRRLRAWKDASEHSEALFSRLALILWIPKKRHAHDTVPEAADMFALITAKTPLEVGEDVGAWETQMFEGVSHAASIIGTTEGPANANRGQNCPVSLLPVLLHFDRRMAAAMNGFELKEVRTLVVGVGALGSQVANNLARSGLGPLTLVDNDTLLPHNLSRHILGGSRVGHPKSQALAEELSGLFTTEPATQSLPLNVLSTESNTRAHVQDAIRHADVILDLSASVAVARYLAHADSEGRRVSAYLNPSGSDLVMLAEDEAREFTLHDLEVQFYRALFANDKLAGHYEAKADRLRFGQGCRDVSFVLPHDRVALHGAIASSEIRVLGSEAAITVWRCGHGGSVRRVDVVPSRVSRLRLGDWTVALDDKLVAELHRSRCEKLPNETGGVLIGSHDLEHLTVHLVMRVPSPSDSTEWPTLYIRGARDLSRRVRSHERATDGMLGYVGEWHSHPVGRDSSPSRLDRRALDNLAKEMGNDGLPALTLIVGENDLTILGQFDGYSGEARWVSHSGAPNPLVYGPTTGRKA